MNKIIFVSAGMLTNKKMHQLKSLYLNYGFLGLATILSQKYEDVLYYQGDIYSVEEMFEILDSNGYLLSKYPLFLSIPSFYAVDWAEKFTNLIKIKYHKKRIICGGRWVMSDRNFLENNLKNIDNFINGQAENIIEALLLNINNILSNKYIDNDINSYDFSTIHLNHSILNEYKKYTPSIELSRGCGRGCIFCADANVKLSHMKSPKQVIKEILNLINLYEDDKLKLYFQSSFFNPKQEWIDDFLELYRQYNLNIKFRCETRVDVLKSSKLKDLSKCGLKVLDLGLESASITQLERMQKTNRPLIYLEKASQLLKACHDNNILAKINILFYAGETQTTINETIEWLEKHRMYIKGLSVHPLIIFGTNNISKDFLESIKIFGATAVYNQLNSNGITNINLSSEISYSQALDISHKISKNFMSINDYFDLKSFGYFPRNFTYNDFLLSINNIDNTLLPFKK